MGETFGQLKPRQLVRTWFIEPCKNAKVQLFRYLFVATIALVGDVVTIALMIKLFGASPVGATTAGYVVGTILNYVLSIEWVFAGRNQAGRATFITFAAISAIGLALTELIIWLTTSGGHLNVFVAKLVATLVVFFWNFGARKLTMSKQTGFWAKLKTAASQEPPTL